MAEQRLGSRDYVVGELRRLDEQFFEELADLRRFRSHPTLGQLVARVLCDFKPQRTAARAYGSAPDRLSSTPGDWLQFAAAAVELVAVLGADRGLDVTHEQVRAALHDAIECAAGGRTFGDTGGTALDRPEPSRRPSSFRAGLAAALLIDELAGRESDGRFRRVSQAFRDVAADALVGVYVLMIQERAADDAAFAAAYRAAVTPPSQPPPEFDLLVGSAEESLIFAPRGQVEEIRATRFALAQCRTWGDACERLAQERLSDLHDWLFGGKDPHRTASDTVLDLGPLHDRGEWPRLYYSCIPEWLPDEVIDAYGRSFSTMMDTGVTFDLEAKDAIVSHLEQLGVRCSHDPDLDDLFIYSEVD